MLGIIRGGDARQRAGVRRAARRAQTMARRITDPALRRCVQRKLAGTGTIIIEQECEEGLLGWNMWTTLCGVKIGASEEIHICLTNHAGDETLLEETLVHEFAHSCCWNHGDGQGVPE